MAEEWVNSKKIYEGAVISVRTGNARLRDGSIGFREMVEHPGGVGVVPVLDGHVIFVRQFRIAMGKEILEIPAGKLEGVEDPLARAAIELEEETGYKAGRLISAGSMYASVGYSSEEIRLFLAFDLEHVGQKCEIDEHIDIVKVSLAEAERMVLTNEIKDGKTIIGLHALFAYLKGKGE